MSKLLFYIILLIACLILLFSCRTTEEHLNNIYKKDPALVARKASEWFPNKNIDTTIKVVVSFDSGKVYQSKIDSLTAIKQHIKDSIAIRYKDSCKTITDNFEEGYNLGMRIGFYDGRLQARRDSFFITKTYTIENGAKIFAAEAKVAEIQKQVSKLQRKNNRLSSWLMASGLAIILLCLIIYLTIRKLIKSAVNISPIK